MTRFWGGCKANLKNKPSSFSAFTLAEMMVVMLILSIVLAAMAPVMTTRNKPNNSSPWQYEANSRQNAYFGAGANMYAMIGKTTYDEENWDHAKLLIATGRDDTNMLAFMKDNTKLGRLYMSNNSLLLGNLSEGSLGTGSTVIGEDIKLTGTNTNTNTVLGYQAKTNSYAGTAVGTYTEVGSSSVAVGVHAKSTAISAAIAIGDAPTAKASDSIAIGTRANADTNAEASIVMGRQATGTSKHSITMGYGANNTTKYSIAIGRLSKVEETADYGIAIGYKSDANGEGAIAIGRGNDSGDLIAKGEDSIAIGTTAYTEKNESIAIGNGSRALQINSIAIGSGAKVEKDSEVDSENDSGSIAIGQSAYASSNMYTYVDDFIHIREHGRYNSIAIGKEATAEKGGIAIGSLNFTNYTETAGGACGGFTPGCTEKQYKARAEGANSIAIGNGALATGNKNIAIGANACSNVSGSNKICIGANSGPADSSSWASDSQEHVFIGSKSNFNNGAAVLEVHNTTDKKYVNHNFKQVNASAVVINGNLIVKGGIYAPVNVLGTGALNPTGTAKIGLINANLGDNWNLSAGNNSRDGAGWTEDLDMFYGQDAYGNYLDLNGSNKVSSRISDRRLKYVGKENTSGLDKIRQLKVFNYTYKKDTTKTPHVGVIAQDLQKVFPDAVKKGADGFLTIRMEDMFFAVINAIKELDAKYQAQEKRITALEKENKEFKARLDRLEAKTK